MFRDTYIFILLMLLLVYSCKTEPAKDTYLPNQEETELELTNREVILSDSEYNQFLKSYYDCDSWKPDRKDIASTREILIKAINSGNFDMFKVPVEEYILNNYFFQYVPYRNEKGERIIYVNAFCETSETNAELIIYDIDTLEPLHIDWTQELNRVEDGGSCYWQMHVNLDQQIYVDLMINGNA